MLYGKDNAIRKEQCDATRDVVSHDKNKWVVPRWDSWIYRGLAEVGNRLPSWSCTTFENTTNRPILEVSSSSSALPRKSLRNTARNLYHVIVITRM